MADESPDDRNGIDEDTKKVSNLLKIILDLYSNFSRGIRARSSVKFC